MYPEFAIVTAYESKKKRFNGKLAQGYSAAGTIGAITALARAIEEGMPAEHSDLPPG